MSSDTVKQSVGRVAAPPKKRRKTIMKPAQRYVIMGAIIVATVACCLGIVEKIVQPFEMQNTGLAALNAVHSQRVATEAENRTLGAQYKYLNSADGKELTARQQGYVKPGEVSVVIENMPPPAPAKPRSVGFTDRIKNAWAKFTGQ